MISSKFWKQRITRQVFSEWAKCHRERVRTQRSRSLYAWVDILSIGIWQRGVLEFTAKRRVDILAYYWRLIPPWSWYVCWVTRVSMSRKNRKWTSPDVLLSLHRYHRTTSESHHQTSSRKSRPIESATCDSFFRTWRLFPLQFQVLIALNESEFREGSGRRRVRSSMRLFEYGK